jgi:iron complex transport system ATP-binding protein
MMVAQDSTCLLLDEPISALDIAHQIEVLTLVRELSVERGVGVVIVLHDINMAARFCDDLIALRSGSLVARGTPRELMRSEVLEAIYGIGMGVLPHPGDATPISFVR